MCRFPYLFAALGLATSWQAPHLLAGQYKAITIDGDFHDWLGVPLSEVDDPDPESPFDIRDVALANDDDYLYVRVRLHAPSPYANAHHQVLVDTDADSSTGHAWGGVGSELFIENGLSYQQKNGQFNEGGGSQLDWAVAPAGTASEFEMRLSRATLDAEGLPFFTGDHEIMVSIMARTLEWQLADSLEGLPYTFATQPEPFTGSKELTNLEDTFWFYQEVGDPEPDWLLPNYLGDDTWQGGNGFFNFGFPDGTFPVIDPVSLTPGRTTYYFRTPFLWEHAAEGVALLAQTHLSDGAVIYLNGDEVRRIRMPQGEIDPGTHALSGPQDLEQAEIFSLPASALITGENLLMVEVHQAAASPESLAFGLTLAASDSEPPNLEDPNQPEDRLVVEGESTTFALGPIAGTEPYQFQWFKDGEPIPDAVSARLEIPIVLQEHAGAYSVEVRNASGTVCSRDAQLTTTALPLSLPNTAQPADQTLTEGDSLVLSIDVTGSPPLSYQWFKNDVAIPLATQESHTIDPAAIEDSGTYHVTVGNRLGSIMSRQSHVTVHADDTAPAIDGITAGATTVRILFSERLHAASASEASHYTIPGITVHRASLLEDRRSVVLETDPLLFGEIYELRVHNVTDRYDNRVDQTQAFRATILIDGDFGDWTGIDPVASSPRNSEGAEFHQFWVANDADFLYLRFSFHEHLGQLPVDFFYQIYIDGDNDPATGLSISTIGSSLMIENGSGWLQSGGAFNEGSVSNVNFQLAPQESSQEFECRISLDAGSADGVPLLTADTLGISFNLVSTSWEVIDSGPAEAILHPRSPWPSLTDPTIPSDRLPPLTVLRASDQVEIRWQEGTLETSDTLLPDAWVPLPDATSPYRIPPDQPARFYRSRD